MDQRGKIWKLTSGGVRNMYPSYQDGTISVVLITFQSRMVSDIYNHVSSSASEEMSYKPGVKKGCGGREICQRWIVTCVRRRTLQAGEGVKCYSEGPVLVKSIQTFDFGRWTTISKGHVLLPIQAIR
uniref:Uncharacterized protein n=1 Tax=Timema poppense TaxID=170557 RepID=A0A7R9CYW4_TIMPO|nr:unnamed protein product [Timema poppensis]